MIIKFFKKEERKPKCGAFTTKATIWLKDLQTMGNLISHNYGDRKMTWHRKNLVTLTRNVYWKHRFPIITKNSLMSFKVSRSNGFGMFINKSKSMTHASLSQNIWN